jgi:hypothetical protein
VSCVGDGRSGDCMRMGYGGKKNSNVTPRVLNLLDLVQNGVINCVRK